MSESSSHSLHVLFAQEGEAWSALARRLQETSGELLLFLSGREGELIAHPDVKAAFLTECRRVHQRLRIATKHPTIAAAFRAKGIRVLDRTKHVRAILQGHPMLSESLRIFSPQLWRQQLKSRLQEMGLLSVPKLRIFSLVALSVLLFGFVVLRLLPSAEVRIRSRQEPISHTVNIFLVQSGATIDIGAGVRRMPLLPITVRFERTTTFDHVSKEFIGTSAQVQLTVVNRSTEPYSLRKGTRFSNQAGMVFRILDPAIVDPGKEQTVRAKADDLDLYDQIIGERGNVPAGLKWEIPGLSPEERTKVYGENRVAAKGGTTAYRSVLRKEDIEMARKRFEQELLATAKQMTEERRAEMNLEAKKGQYFVILNYPELTTTFYEDFVLPTQFLGEEVTSVPMAGAVRYTVFAYDADAILSMLHSELSSHVQEGRRLMENQIDRSHMTAHVIDYADDLSWVKLTVDLSAAEQYILDPLSPTGALFAKRVRERIVGVSEEEALRIIKNMPEVEAVEIRQWPPWQGRLPRIASHIAITPL